MRWWALPGVDQRLTEIRDGVNSQVASEVKSINAHPTRSPSLNQAILLSRAGGLGQEPNDLLDQRDQLIAELNKSVRVSTVEQNDGSINIHRQRPAAGGRQSALHAQGDRVGTRSAADRGGHGNGRRQCHRIAGIANRRRHALGAW